MGSFNCFDKENSLRVNQKWNPHAAGNRQFAVKGKDSPPYFTGDFTGGDCRFFLQLICFVLQEESVSEGGPLLYLQKVRRPPP